MRQVAADAVFRDAVAGRSVKEVDARIHGRVQHAAHLCVVQRRVANLRSTQAQWVDEDVGVAVAAGCLHEVRACY